MPGSLTLKKESTSNRDSSKRKIVAVPELLPERVELTKQSNEVEVEVEVEPMQVYLDSEGEMLESMDQPVVKSRLLEIMPQLTTGTTTKTSENVEILGQRIIDSTLSSALSCTVPKTSVLVLTTDGNYVITRLDDDVNKTDDIQDSPPQVKEIIVLNGNNVQLTNMGLGIDYQTIQYENENENEEQTIVDDVNAR